MLLLAAGDTAKEGDGILLDVDLVLQVGEVGSEEVLRPPAIRAVSLGKDDDLVAGNGIFDGLLSRHGCSGRG